MVQSIDYSFIVILGLVLVSFFNVCIYRIPREESISYPSSHCGTCKHRLYPLDLIPLISYICLKGRCRYCNAKISIRYPIIEGLNAILYIIIFYKFGYTLGTLKYFLLVSFLIVISVIDFKTHYIYTSTIVFGVISGVCFIALRYFLYSQVDLNFILGGILGAFIISLIVFITNGMGEGDIEIAGVCGLFLGDKLILLTLFLAVAIGGIAAIVILVLNIKKAKEKIAFGPFIAMGSLISLLYGNELIQWYLGMYI